MLRLGNDDDPIALNARAVQTDRRDAPPENRDLSFDLCNCQPLLGDALPILLGPPLSRRILRHFFFFFLPFRILSDGNAFRSRRTRAISFCRLVTCCFAITPHIDFINRARWRPQP